ncbi:MAG: DUF3263 domain-containing protein [Acidimicrobiia bacterium]|nr:DUF3263 domain-containing protein [Acidimicrobiia bacterium]
MLASGALATQTTRVQLGERERAILDVEREWWLDHPTKEQAIRATLQVTPSTYYRLLHVVIDDPAAMAYDPLVVRRLQRARRARRRVRLEGSWVGMPPQNRP